MEEEVFGCCLFFFLLAVNRELNMLFFWQSREFLGEFGLGNTVLSKDINETFRSLECRVLLTPHAAEVQGDYFGFDPH